MSFLTRLFHLLVRYGLHAPSRDPLTSCYPPDCLIPICQVPHNYLLIRWLLEFLIYNLPVQRSDFRDFGGEIDEGGHVPTDESYCSSGFIVEDQVMSFYQRLQARGISPFAAV